MKRYTLAGILAVLVLAGGCSSKESRPKEHVAKAKEADKPATGPRRGGNLRLPSNEPRYLNPVIETRFNRATPLIFEGLVGLGGSLEPAPALAQAWDISKDGKTITFRLRKNVTWHDGKPFTSADVVFTFESMRKTSRPTVWKGYFAAVDALEAPDDHTVIVRYKHAYAPALVSWTMGILPAHVYNDAELGESKGNTEPVGTGPYKLSRHEPGQRMILVANESWWSERPYIDSIELVFKAGDAIEDLTSGAVHFAQITSVEDWVTRAQLPEFRESFETTSVVESRFRTIAWNTKKKPFDDKRIRLAMTLSLDRDRVIENVFQGQAQRLSAPFFPNMFGLDSQISPHPFDLARAIKLFDEAGYPAKEDGTRFTIELIALDSLRGPNSDEMLAIFRRDLKAIGIEMHVRFLAPKEFFDRLSARDFDAAYFGWLPDIPDPDPYSLLHSSQVSAGQNFAAYENPEVDALLEEARNTLSRDERRTLYQKLHRILNDELPYTPLYAPFGHYAWSRQVHAVNPDDVGSQSRIPGIAKWWMGPPQ